jgi:type I restriction enzyme S subunit
MKYRLGDICAITKGEIGIMKAIPGNYKMITLGEENKTHNEFQFDTNAVIIPLVSSTGHGHASMKRVKYAEGKFALGSILCAVIPKDEKLVLAKYLQIYLHENREKLLVTIMKGAANVSLPIKRIYDVEVIIPSIEKQKKIIELETTKSKSEIELIEKYSSQKRLLVQLRQSFVQNAIKGKLTTDWRKENQKIEPALKLLEQIKATKERLLKDKKIKNEKPLPTIKNGPFELPSNWTWAILDEIVIFTNGKAHEQLVDANGKYVLINSKFVSTNGDVRKHSNELLCPLNKNDIAIVMSDVPDGRALSRCFLVDRDETYTLNQRIGSLTSIDGINPKYLQLVLDRNSFYLSFNDSKKQTNLKKEQILSCPIPLPPLEEQNAIVEKVDLLMTKCTGLENEIINSEKYANQLMQAVLKEAFETNTEVCQD